MQVIDIGNWENAVLFNIQQDQKKNPQNLTVQVKENRDAQSTQTIN